MIVAETTDMTIKRYQRALRELVRAVELGNHVRLRCRFCRMTSQVQADPTPELHNALIRAKQTLMGV